MLYVAWYFYLICSFSFFLLGAWSGDWSFVHCPWQSQGGWSGAHVGATRRLWGASTFSAPHCSHRSWQTAGWARPVSRRAAHQDTRWAKHLLRWCVDVILLTLFDRLVLLVCAELTKLKLQLEVPGSTGTLTGAADRKLEDGQRVSNCCTK